MFISYSFLLHLHTLSTVGGVNKFGGLSLYLGCPEMSLTERKIFLKVMFVVECKMFSVRMKIQNSSCLCNKVVILAVVVLQSSSIQHLSITLILTRTSS